MANIVEDTVKFLLDCGRVLTDQVTPSIFMVPKEFRDPSPSSFNPKIVFLELPPEETLRACAEKVIDSMETIKACYAGPMTYDDFELAKIMTIDACFIIAFLQSVGEESSTTNMLISRSIIDDLLLLENQIPFFILNIIFECTIVASDKFESAPLTTYIEQLLNFYRVFKGDFVVPNVSLATTHEHILGFVHSVYQPGEPVPSLPTSSIESHSATELDRAEMKFKPHRDDNWALAMKLELPSPLFSWFRSPTLKMRMISIHESTELVIRNLMIYEQFSSVNKYVTSYVLAIDMLIDTPQDVSVLVNFEVLRNNLGSNEDAANVVNNLAKDISAPTFYYGQQWKEMDVYYNSYCPNTVAGLKRTYFNNPWSIITVFAAIVLFALTVTQTIFSVKSA